MTFSLNLGFKKITRAAAILQITDELETTDFELLEGTNFVKGNWIKGLSGTKYSNKYFI